MAILKSTALVSAFERYLAEGWGYVYGGQGELYDKETAQEWKAAGRSVPSGRIKATYFTVDCKKWYGHRVADCSGGIITAFREVKPTYRDQTANGLFNKCTRSGTIDTLPEAPGLCLWKSGHIGVYIGGGWGIEFRGTSYGCVKTQVSKRPWTHWGALADIEYPEFPEVEEVWRVKRVLKLTEPMQRGDDVEELQKRLLDWRLVKVLVDGTPKTLKADGIFGPATEAAVKAFQTAKRLTVDGKAGKNTVTALGGKYGA